jgi:hypothetical protein
MGHRNDAWSDRMTDIRDQHTASNGHTYTYSGILVMHGDRAVVQNLRVVEDASGRPANIRVAEFVAGADTGTTAANARQAIRDALDHLT